MALDALTITPFVVIDDKLVIIFNGNTYVKVKEQGIWLHEVERTPHEDVDISNLPLNANAHGRFHFVDISLFIMKSRHSAYKEYFEDNVMHNDKWAYAE